MEPGRRLSGSDAIFQHAAAALLDLTGFVRQDMAVRGQLPNPAAHFLKVALALQSSETFLRPCLDAENFECKILYHFHLYLIIIIPL